MELLGPGRQELPVVERRAVHVPVGARRGPPHAAAEDRVFHAPAAAVVVVVVVAAAAAAAAAALAFCGVTQQPAGERNRGRCTKGE